MGRTTWKATLAVAGMAMLLSPALRLTAGEEDMASCEDACAETEEQCYVSCEVADDPDACELRCDGEVDHCYAECER